MIFLPFFQKVIGDLLHLNYSGKKLFVFFFFSPPQRSIGSVFTHLGDESKQILPKIPGKQGTLLKVKAGKKELKNVIKKTQTSLRRMHQTLGVC